MYIHIYIYVYIYNVFICENENKIIFSRVLACGKEKQIACSGLDINQQIIIYYKMNPKTSFWHLLPPQYFLYFFKEK